MVCHVRCERHQYISGAEFLSVWVFMVNYGILAFIMSSINFSAILPRLYKKEIRHSRLNVVGSFYFVKRGYFCTFPDTRKKPQNKAHC